MKSTFSFEFSSCQVVEFLWPQFVERLGLEKSKHAIRQALDLQRMNGTKFTLPVLIIETCGLAIVSTDILYSQTGILCSRDGLILLVSIKQNTIQLISPI